ncbi:hypothetical protein [Acuticoccus sp. I52.16.1]|uniref:hypothetical protein n=1 Tax=Acuticoccus sp. I52.16.1 TaxID=2928472 RepID=UPI001FD61F01|nr:hypothetical protein [Acuticoccus sp. I52.16.1]UOM35755.1 hypothetical protein MRB58_06005 [Acuticoccus sp. I52.16.1]
MCIDDAIRQKAQTIREVLQPVRQRASLLSRHDARAAAFGIDAPSIVIGGRRIASDAPVVP